MESIAFENYRCIRHSGPIIIKPITLLLGANSTGKSSVLKFFPLLKQSASTKTRGSFLWYGPFVDFQDFENVVKEGENSMTISFDLSNVTSSFIAILFHHNQRTTFKNLHVDLKIEKRPKDATDYLREAHISFPKCEITIKYANTEKIASIIVNKTELDGENILALNRGDFIPLCVDNQSEKGAFSLENIGNQRLPVTLSKALRQSYPDNYQTLYREIDEKARKHLENYNLLHRTINSFLLNSSENIDEICNSFIIENINVYISTINQYLEALAQRTHYVQPLRATSQRFYRFSNVDVDEIDSDGKNLPMFYASLSEADRKKFNKWLGSVLLDTQLEIQTKSGFIELLLKERGKSARNMVDVGFGYTQILPILILIWKIVYISKSRSLPIMDIETPTIIAIEQPELHLHPRMQGQFADMLVKVLQQCKQDKIDVRFIIETHSESIISRLGEVIEQKNNNLDDDINVVLFNAKEEGFATDIHEVKYNKLGLLEDWPYNFFTHNVY